jgi:hypothetical protein
MGLGSRAGSGSLSDPLSSAIWFLLTRFPTAFWSEEEKEQFFCSIENCFSIDIGIWGKCWQCDSYLRLTPNFVLYLMLEFSVSFLGDRWQTDRFHQDMFLSLSDCYWWVL